MIDQTRLTIVFKKNYVNDYEKIYIEINNCTLNILT